MYEEKEGRIFQRHQLPSGSKLLLTSRDIRRERTGIHAVIEIFLNQVVLAYDTFNIDRNEERVRLANSAHAQMSELEKGGWTKADMKHGLDEFLIGLWRQHLHLDSARVETDYDTTPALPEFVLEPYVLKDAGTIMYGPPERGKSTTAMIMAMCVDAGLERPWRAPMRMPVLYVNLERSAQSIYRRAGRTAEALGLPESYRLPLYNARGRSLADIADSVKEIVRQQGVGLVILDSISRAGFGDLIDNQVANKVADALNGLNTAWLAIGHTPRGDDSHLFGSMMFEAAADVMLGMLTERANDGRLGIGLKVTKANDMQWPPQQRWAYEFDEYGLTLIRDARDGEFWELEEQQEGPEGQLRRHLLANGEASIVEAATALGMPYKTAAHGFQALEKAQIVQSRQVKEGGRGAPTKKYSVLARHEESHNDQQSGSNFSRYENKSEKKGETPLGGSLSLGENNSAENNSGRNLRAFEPCAGCSRLSPPERYTPGGKPLCEVCAENGYSWPHPETISVVDE